MSDKIRLPSEDALREVEDVLECHARGEAFDRGMAAVAAARLARELVPLAIRLSTLEMIYNLDIDGPANARWHEIGDELRKLLAKIEHGGGE